MWHTCCSNVLEMMKPELARSDEDEFIGREQPSAQQFQALKDGAAGFNGVGPGGSTMQHNSVDHKAVRVEADYERGLYRCAAGQPPQRQSQPGELWP